MKRPPLALALLALAACAGPAPAPPAPAPRDGGPVPARSREARYDLLVRGGTVLDGTGAPGVRADVAVRGDRIVAVGVMPGATARDTLDATGLVVAPGFIDMLGHSEYPLLRDGRALSKITQGITTEITGEVTSVVPVNENTLRELPAEYRPLVDWTDLDGYFRSLERRGTAINLGTFVTVGSVRRYVMGDADRAPTPQEMERMRALVGEAMEQGAMGLSTGMIYAPASFASAEEVTDLARVAARHGGGYASHIRSEGDRLVEAVNEAIGIGERAGTWVQIHHLKASGKRNWGKVRDAVAAIEAARARGVDVTADQYPYPASGTDLDAVLPNWVHAGGRDALLGRLADPATRARIVAELTGEGPNDWRIGTSAGGPSGVMIAGVDTDSLKKYEGMRLDAVAAARGQGVADAVVDIVLADSSRTSAIFFSMSEADVEYVMRQPWVSIGIDAGSRAADSTVRGKPHPRAYGSFPRILCRYVRERGVLALPEAVRRFTSLAASRVGLSDRGVVRSGAFADLTVFDPATVCDTNSFEDPVRLSVGIRHVVVNGTPVLRGGTPTGARPGRGIRRGGGGR